MFNSKLLVMTMRQNDLKSQPIPYIPSAIAGHRHPACSRGTGHEENQRDARAVEARLPDAHIAWFGHQPGVAGVAFSN